MEFSAFGQRIAARSGIVQLMDDLGEALNVNPDILFMGGGNPAHIPALEQWAQNAIVELASEPQSLRRLIGIYQSPQGQDSTLRALAGYLKKHCGWRISERNIVLVNGSQTAFFILLNLFGGRGADGELRPIGLPLTPEYLGYASQGVSGELTDSVFEAAKPRIEWLNDRRFKYHVDFDKVRGLPKVGAYCVSRPTNPSGNLLSDCEMDEVGDLAREQRVPLIVDSAYGLPFPGLIYGDAQPYWDTHCIAVMSLSKLGFPGARTGIIVASEEVVEAVTRVNTLVSLASGNFGPMLLDRLVQGDHINRLCRDELQPFYRRQRDFLVAQLDAKLAGTPYALHEPEGAMFVWLWLRDLPITSLELYQRLKKRGVLVMAGEEFFFGLRDDWPHRRQCLRLTYCQNTSVMTKAVDILAEEIKALYG